MDLGLKGKKALVTGGSRGIGRAIADTLAAEGADVALCARGEEGVQTAVAALEQHGGRVFGAAVDVRDGDALKAWIASAAEQLGGIDIYVSNPSGGGGQGEEGWRAIFEVDMLGAVRGTEAALPYLEASDAGSVLYVSTTAAVESFVLGGGAYAALKAALINYSNQMSQSLAANGIRVNVVSPGPIYFEGGGWANVEQRMPDLFKGVVADVAMGRMGTAEEVARASAFLVSPAADFITGVNLVIDGGLTKRVNF